MVLESTILCVDNTEYSRNGDFTPSRFGAQQDLIQTLARSKIRSHPENVIGLIATAGDRPTIVNTLTSDSNKLLTGFAKLDFNGDENNFSTALRTAHLALKHRMSKNQKQRIIIMICSPLVETEQELVKLAKKLKKENVCVDIINFGEDEVNLERLAKFIETLNGKSTDPANINNHLVNIPAGSNVNEAVRNSAICGGTSSSGNAGGAGIQGGAAMGGDDDWMDDPNMDPELALALRVSLEESRARQQQQNQQSSSNNANNLETIAEGANADSTNNNNNNSTPAANANNNTDDQDDAMTADDAALMQALQLSLQNANNDGDEEDGEDDDDDDDEGEEGEVNLAGMTEEEQIAFALQMSMADNQNNKEDDDDNNQEDMN